MKILVTGGTGFLGKRLVNKLLDEGHDVVVYSHESYPSRRIRFVTGDIRNKDALRKAVDGVDVVYHLAACLDESDPNLRDINVRGTQNVAELCKEFKIKQLILMSTTSVLGEPKHANETMPYNPETEYEKSKMESELIVKKCGVTYIIIRAPIIIGPNMIWAAIFEAAKRQYPVIGSGKNFFHLVYVDDVVDLLVLVKNNRKATSQIFHIATNDVNTYEQVYKMITDVLDVGMTTKHVPEWLAMAAAGFHEWKSRMRGKKPKLTKMKSSIKRLTRNRIISTKKAREILGFEPKYSTKEALRETIKYLRIFRLGYSDYDLAALSKIKSEVKENK